MRVFPNHRQSIVSLRQVGKRYRSHWVLQDIDLTLSEGEIVGFIGPNGAGKTTLMKIMAGLTRATTGSVEVLGQRLDAHSLRTPPDIGIVLEQVGFVPYLSGQRNLTMLSTIRGTVSAERIATTLQLVGLDPQDRRPVRAYSLGMRQRLGLAQALLNTPKLLLLDEPTNGLDPSGIIELRTLLRKIAETGTTIFLASHLLTEVEQLCHRVLLVQQGRVVKEIDTTTSNITQIHLAVSDDPDAVLVTQWAHRRNLPVESGRDAYGYQTFLFPAIYPVPQVIRELVEAGVRIESASLTRPSLETEFLAITRQGRE
ncbi:MAG: ABC transporter ATP-binding protein [Chloroflexi bacterium AL-W]|nr:ABC transporter ATP-binding protein [Chloroflexi bacterium AL-N1]NOK66896.1 ABC transporter ATP-binding protein [Chloroflexi bacterium AL-N10]NOK74812.1 ABC transporter ATP-binding protein [Chloroflexi bacterium AL-N5]NOK81498.1 ABC transporter ATP-binding protein [Chloroflexi bacterium AL-W]NOK88968.1 ABC transporter ATP-binding protein [Chloroflexi bacterium AL-N15]